LIIKASTTKVKMSEETHVDQIESGNNVESNVVLYSTRFVERTIERALGLYIYYIILFINKTSIDI